MWVGTYFHYDKNNKKTIILRLKFPNFIQRGKVIERLFKEDKDRY